MVKKIISVATAFLMLCCMIPFGAFADDVLEDCPKCGEHTYTKLQDFSMSTSDFSFPIAIKKRYCSSCNYTYYEWNCLGMTGYKEFDDGGYSVIVDYLREWANKTFGKNATATKFTAGGGSTDGSGVGRRPAGYADDNGTPSVSATGALTITAKLRLYPQRYDTTNGNSYSYVDSYADIENYSISKNGIVCVGSSSGVRVTNGTASDVYVIFAGGYMLDVPSAGYIGVAEGTKAYIGMDNYVFSNSAAKELWSISKPFSKATSKLYGKTVSANEKYFLKFDPIDSSDWQNSSINVSFNLSSYSTTSNKYSIPMGNIYWIPANSSTFLPYNTVPVVYYPNTSSVKSYNDITINNNIWNGNIYVDNSNDLTYIYPEYTTINENNETVTNISTNPIIYNNETKQYYTYDSVTQNYYYITYNESPATPTPSPSPTPDPDNPDVTPTPTPDNPSGGNTGGGSTSTPETGDKDNSGSSGWSWNPFKWLTDLLKDIVETILKGLWKLLTSIFGFILWLLSLLFKLFPWMPNSGILALCAGVVVVTVIRIIKFITGR